METDSHPAIEEESPSLPIKAVQPQTSDQACQTAKRKMHPNTLKALTAARDRYNAQQTRGKMERLRLKMLGYGYETVPTPTQPAPPAPPPINIIRYC